MKLSWLSIAIVGLGLAAARAAAADPVPQNDLLNATLWEANAIEYKANALAAFELAKIRLDQAIADRSWTATGQTGTDFPKLPVAIIADLDETFLDNSGYESWLVKSGKSFSGKSYDDWTKAMQAAAVPGAVEFANYAKGKGVTVFYVTNRDVTQEEATRKNMETLGFPMDGDVDTLLMAKEKPEWTAKKKSRFDFISKDYRVLLLLGDNYGDFTDNYGGTEADRLKDFEANKAHFGHDWIMLANPEYGSFECAPFSCDYSLSPDDQRQKKIDALPAWSGPME